MKTSCIQQKLTETRGRAPKIVRHPWVTLVLAISALVILTHWPEIPMPSRGAGVGVDKWFHFLAYGMLGILSMNAALAWVGKREPGILFRTGLLVTLAVAVLASLDEMTQPLVGRTFELGDWLADCAGASVSTSATALAHWMRPGFRRRRRKTFYGS